MDEIDVHANDDQQRRAREAQVSKCLPTGHQSSLLLGVGLDETAYEFKYNQQLAEVFSVSPKARKNSEIVVGRPGSA